MFGGVNAAMFGRDEILILPTGRRIGYRLYGVDSAPRLLYLHGRPGSRAEVGLYDEELLLDRKLCVVAMDRPGYGLTDPLEALDPLSRATDAAALLEHLDLSDVTVQGTSGGGVPALATGVLARSRVRAIILTSAGGLNDPAGSFADLPDDYREGLLRERDDRPSARRDAEEFAEALATDQLGAWRSVTAHWPADERALVEKKADRLAEDSREAVRTGGLGYFLDNMSSWRSWPLEILALDLPVHVFHGEQDQWSPMASVRRMLAPLRDVHWTTYTGDHFAPWLTPERQSAMLDVATAT